MPASMRVYLDRVAEAFLLPTNAVFGSGGKTFILVVRDGVTKQLPVRVQVNDGRMAKVAFVAAVRRSAAVARSTALVGSFAPRPCAVPWMLMIDALNVSICF